MTMEPIMLPANQPANRFYQGGARISEFRGIAVSGPNTPEDWVASTTAVRGAAPVGLTRLPDERRLVDAVRSDPRAWLGPDHQKRFGDDVMLLVKLLDAGQRLPIHAHPDDAFAMDHLGAAHGKAEAWYILRPGVVHLGLTRDFGAGELSALVAAQRTDELLGRMHRVAVEAGDSVFVPHGMLHAIGEGILLVEVQQPEDLSIVLEWSGFELDGEVDGHLGVGFGLAHTAVERRGRTADEVDALVRRAPSIGSVLPPAADAFFRLDLLYSGAALPAGFAVVVVLDGPARLTTAFGSPMMLDHGSTVLVPHASGTLSIDSGRVLVARPPAAG